MTEGVIAGKPLTDTATSRRSKASDLANQAWGAVFWGLFFSVAPIAEGLFFGAILWIPLFVWREGRRTRTYGFLPGFALRLAIISAIVTGAIHAPTKWEDTTIVEGLSGKTVTLAELSRKTRLYCSAEDAEVKVDLPSSSPTLRQTLQAIEAQTPFRCDIGRCGNGKTLLRGGAIMGIGVHRR